MSRPTTSPKSSASYFRDLITFWFKSDISKTLTSTFAPSFSQLDFKIFAVRTRSGAFEVEIEKLNSLFSLFLNQIFQKPSHRHSLQVFPSLISRYLPFVQDRVHLKLRSKNSIP